MKNLSRSNRKNGWTDLAMWKYIKPRLIFHMSSRPQSTINWALLAPLFIATFLSTPVKKTTVGERLTLLFTLIRSLSTHGPSLKAPSQKSSKLDTKSATGRHILLVFLSHSVLYIFSSPTWRGMNTLKSLCLSVWIAPPRWTPTSMYQPPQPGPQGSTTGPQNSSHSLKHQPHS